MNITPSAESTAPSISVKYIIMENSFSARSPSPSPSVLATSAVPPVPTMKPIPPSTITNGMIRFTAANAVFPTKLETKNPSTTP